MKLFQALGYFLRSREHGILLGVSGLLALGAGLVSGSWILIPGITLGASYLVLGTGAFLSPLGSRALVRVKESDRLRKQKITLQKYQQLREELAMLRVADPELKKSLEYFLLISGQYFQAARDVGSYSPKAHAAMEKVQELCQLLLEEQNEESVQKRYAIADTDDFEAFRKKALDLMAAYTQDILEETKFGLKGLSREEVLQITDEMKANGGNQ